MSNTPPFDLLTRPQRLALLSIVAGDPPRRTAGAAGVTDRTVRKWRKLPVFEEALAEARRDFFSACRSHLNASLVVSFRSLFEAAGSSWSESDRLKASVFLLDRVTHTEMSAKPPTRTANSLK